MIRNPDTVTRPGLNHLVLVTGEVSGDMHAARLIAELRKLDRHFEFSGLGGDCMIGEGFRALRHSKQMAFLGLGEVLRHLPLVRRVFKELISHITKIRPRAVILVDYPGFNLRLAKKIKKIGVPVIYYISPQIWAWGRGRIKKIKKYIDYMLVLFPFEVDFYSRHGIRVDYVGHPLVDIYHDRVQPKVFRQQDRKILGLLPGSRMQELNSLLGDMIATARELRQKNLIDRVLIAAVNHIPDSVYKHYIGREEYIDLFRGNMNQFYNQLDAALVSSGTATLETAYFRVPMVIVYRVHKLTWLLGRMLVRIDRIGLANIVAEDKIADELLQHNFQVQKASALLAGLLQPAANRELRERMKIVQEKLGAAGASARAAQKVSEFIRGEEGNCRG
jgi:lipid-A-disaccharide synthase